MAPDQRLSCAIFLAAALAIPAAHAASVNVKITDAWMRALPSNLPAGGYFTLRNESAKPVTLTGASSPRLRDADAAQIRHDGRHDADGRCDQGWRCPLAAR